MFIDVWKVYLIWALRIAAFVLFYIGVEKIVQIAISFNWDPLTVYIFSTSRGNSLPLALGLLLFCVSLRRAILVYASLYPVAWLLVTFFWYQFPGNELVIPVPVWHWLFLLGISLLLAILFKPLMTMLTRLLSLLGEKKRQDYGIRQIMRTPKERT